MIAEDFMVRDRVNGRVSLLHSVIAYILRNISLLNADLSQYFLTSNCLMFPGF